MKVDVMILGAMKCGTTTLADLLKAHPSIVLCKEKEPDFFSQTKNWREELPEYHALYEQRPGAMYVEASTSYTFYPHFNRGIWKDLHDYNPDLKFIYLVRDPIQRTISHYMHVYERGFIDKSLEDAVRTIPLIMNNSRYAAQVRPFIETFGRERLLLLDFEDLIKDRERTLQQVADFMSIDAKAFPLHEEMHSNRSIGGNKLHHQFDDKRAKDHALLRYLPAALREKVWKRMTANKTRGFDKKPELSPDLKEAVMRLLELEVLDLERLMGRDFTKWFTNAGLERPEKRLSQ